VMARLLQRYAGSGGRGGAELLVPLDVDEFMVLGRSVVAEPVRELGAAWEASAGGRGRGTSADEQEQQQRLIRQWHPPANVSSGHLTGAAPLGAPPGAPAPRGSIRGHGEPYWTSRSPVRAISVRALCRYLDAMPLSFPGYKASYLEPAMPRSGLAQPLTTDLTNLELARFAGGPANKWRLAKTFYSTRQPIPPIDHGNHMGKLAKRALVTPLLLVHHHTRSAEQLRAKIVNNWRGFGYPFELRAAEKMRPPFQNQHYLAPVLSILRGEPVTVAPKFDARIDVIPLWPLTDHLRNLSTAA